MIPSRKLSQTIVYYLQVILLNALREPVARTVYDYILRCGQLEQLLEALQDRQLIRNICRPGHPPNYTELDEQLTHIFRKLFSMGMSEVDEDKILVSVNDLMLSVVWASDKLTMDPDG